MYSFTLTNYFFVLVVTGIIHFSLAVFIILKGIKKRLNQTYALYSISISVWSIFEALAIVQTDKILALQLWRVSQSGVVFIPLFFIHFVFTSVGIKDNKRGYIPFFYLLAFSFLLANVTSSLFVADVVPKFSFNFFINPGYLYYVFFSLWILGAVYGLTKLFKKYFRTSGEKRNQLRYFCWSMLVAYIGGIPNFFPTFNIEIPILMPFGTYAISVYAFFTAYAIIKYRLMDIRVAVTRAGIFLTVYTLVLGLPFWLGYNVTPKSWFIPTFFMFILASIGPLVYRFLQKKAENILLAQQRRYQKVLLQAAGGMVKQHNLEKLLKLIVYVVKRIVRLQFAAIFLEDRDNHCYRLKAVRDHHNFPLEFTLSESHPFIKLIKKKRTILAYEEIKPFLAEITKQEVYLVIPSFIENRLSGILMLGEKENKTLYTEDDINVFRILSHQAALAIENCLFFEEFKKAQEKIFVAEKLASIGGMADGVAHQIKNRLNHFSIATGEMQYEISDFIKANSAMVTDSPPLKKTFDYLTKIAESLITNVKRTDGVIKGILSYARTSEKDTYFSEFSFQEIIDLALDLLKVKHEIAEFPLTFELDPSSDIVYGVKSQILEVIYNLLDNAYEAAREKALWSDKGKHDSKKFKPLVKLKLIQKEKFSLVEISDNGIGVKEEDRRKIFAPFFTTKSSYKSGTGIGMYVVKRLIEENHHGRVWFSSVYGEGTQMFVKLPKK